VKALKSAGTGGVAGGNIEAAGRATHPKLPKLLPTKPPKFSLPLKFTKSLIPKNTRPKFNPDLPEKENTQGFKIHCMEEILWDW